MIGVHIASLYEVIFFSISVRATRAECDSVRRYGCLGQVRKKKKRKEECRDFPAVCRWGGRQLNCDVTQEFF
jgi:hypothetical protein